MKNTRLALLLAGWTALNLSAQHRLTTPMMGWSSWNTFSTNITDSLIESQAHWLVKTGLKEAGYNFVNIDAGFLEGRDAEGHLLTDSKKFPMGLYSTVDYIHFLGLKAGIYSDAGRNTCTSFWLGDKKGLGVGLYGHEAEDVDFFFKQSGFDYIKIDFCGGDAKQNLDSLSLCEKERYTSIRNTLDSVGFCNLPIGVCRWAYPGTWVADIAHSWRISPDIRLSWKSIKSIIRKNSFLSAYAQRGAFNDMDMLEIGRGLGEAEERTHFGMWCMMSSPLIIGCDLSCIPEKSLNLLKNKELIGINQDILGLQAYQVREDRGVVLYVKDIEILMGNKRAIAVCNTSNENAVFELDFSEIDLGGSVEALDVFAGGTTHFRGTEKMKISVPAHDTRIFKLTASRRVDRKVYEAETAWMKDFQCLVNPVAKGTPYYEVDAAMSGGGKVCGLGVSNSGLEWQHVYVQQGGVYDWVVDYISPDLRDISIRVNDAESFSRYVCSGNDGKVGSCHFRVRLQRGFNKIRLFSRTKKGPEIDVARLSLSNDKKL